MIVAKEKLAEAIGKALEEENKTKREFKQSVDMIVTFRDVDMKRGDIKLREVVSLPKPPSKERKVLVVPTFEQTEYAKKAEPNLLLPKDELQKLQGNKRAIKKIATQNDWFLIAPDSMALAGRILGPALGPRGKFPTPLPGAADVTEYVNRYKRSTLLKTKDQPHAQALIGLEDQKPDDLAENSLAVLSVIETKVSNALSKVGNIYIKTTMGKPIKVSTR
ncbi:50S ribosomal protein L1 [Sulfuracidifex tepidarius]|uniref:Large ribosomal subunit protein uL1 n=1 Tax=Sulfuracidifex tepidarius TaxID=1294262 RepID=A0A510E3L0_9CREN|nr:50S ribosomal protein L1 [Sulfuracidifex tepidarius]BBG26658.1 50S ribosomal protein L1 [Sulfuracidifex tepidarius]